GQPALQTAAGIDPAGTRPPRQAGKNLLHRELLQKRIAELKSQIPEGGLREAVIRGMLYVGMARKSIDERGFETVRRIRETHGEMVLPEFKRRAREQLNRRLIDRAAALAAIPTMLPSDDETRAKAFELIAQVLAARGELSAEDKRRLGEIARLFRADDGPGEVRPFTPPAARRAS